MRQIIQDIIEEKVEAVITDVDSRPYLIFGVGFATFFFGFAAGAILNLYLLWVNSPLVLQFRAILSYKSAIFGDGIILPVVNMIAMTFILKHWNMVRKRIIHLALFLGFCITAYFNIMQAVEGIINWAMPKPWQWNFLGVWHAVYMFSVASFLSLFYLVLLKVMRHRKRIPKEAAIVTIGLVIFLILLRLDYIAIDLKSLAPSF
ncbi:MAG: hypothetical protein HYV39_04250 [Candidatus Levybacteria bacterium]|nr:hypothetical protein [Candidatus Levybacteria bacterium]